MPLARISLAKGKPEVEVAKENWSFGNGVASYAATGEVAHA